MGKLFKILNTFLIIVIVCVVVGGIYIKKSIDHSLPQRSGKITLAGLKDSVEVLFDKHAIPHVSCKKESDCAEALGFLHAQDRLFQMEMLRRVGGGRLSEVFGEKTLQTDRFFRTLGLREVAKEQVKKLKNTKAERFFSA